MTTDKTPHFAVFHLVLAIGPASPDRSNERKLGEKENALSDLVEVTFSFWKSFQSRLKASVLGLRAKTPGKDKT